MNVFDFLFEQSNSFDKDFVLGPRQHISYNELFLSANRLSNKIIQLIGSNNNIIILSENSVNQIIFYLAILKSGNICIPLNPAIEKENLIHLVRRTETKYAYVSKKNKERCKDLILNILDDEFLKDSEDFWHYREDWKTSEFDGNNIAEIIFTSGSTGEQKGVLISHKNIITNTKSIIQYLNLSSSDTMEVVLPFYYCYGLSLLHTHLAVGGSIVLNNNFIFIGSVIQEINKYKCTGFAGVPSHFQILLRKTKDFKTTKFPTLRYVTQAGGKLHTTFIKEFAETFPETDFVVMYGQTEATARLSFLPKEYLFSKMGSIGKGIPGVSLKVVNEAGESVKQNETGEIIAFGENIMLGYLNEPEETAKTIRNGWLYTGDLARIDDEGFIFIESRKKEIIKVGGMRVSPSEIEEVIVTYPGVISCSVEAVLDDLQGESIKAIVYVNEADLYVFQEDNVRRFCATKLSSHKVPKFVVFETVLPFNATGKKVK